MNTAKSTRRVGLLVAIAAAVLSLQLLAVSTAGAATHGWQIVAISNSTVSAGGELTYAVEVINRSEAQAEEGSKVTLTLPAGLSGVSSESFSGFDCGSPAGLSVITCTLGSIVNPENKSILRITAAVDPGATGIKTAHFEASGGGLARGTTVDPVRISPTPASFGIDAFDMQIGDPAAPYTRAAGHPPVQTTALEFNTATDESPTSNPIRPDIGPNQPIEPVKDIVVDLPAGLVGSPADVAQCDSGQLANTNGGITPLPLCDPSSQVGMAEVYSNGLDILGTVAGPYPIFNMVPPAGVPARFGINVLGTLVALDASVRSGSDYGLRITSSDTSAGISIIGSKVDFWGVPADPAHEFERSCSGKVGPREPSGGVRTGCPSSAEPAAFLRTPTACSDSGLEASLRANSWFRPADFASRSIRTHAGPGYPYASQEWGHEVGIEGCDQVPFEPTIETELSTDSADAPTGLSVDLGLPADCWDAKATAQEAEEAICQSDMKEARVTLPQGISLNPSAAGGLDSCSAQQVGLSTPIGSSPVHFDEAPASCPDSSKIGRVEIATPQLALHGKDGKPVLDGQGNPVLEPLKGSIYLARQGQNPFGSLVALYLVAEGSGVRVKQAGRIEFSNNGQLITTFDAIPQSPVSNIHFELFGGPRAALRTPPTCGTYTTEATLTPWAGNAAVNAASSFQITQGCGGGFDPKLSAGTQNPLAGSFSPFSLRLTREDASQEIAKLDLTLAPGLIGAPKGIAYCPDSVLATFPAETILGSGAGEEAHRSCPAGSQLGSVTVGAGAGANPFYTSSGRAYLAGPYHGAPLSIAVLAPAVAGPFDLGTVLVRNGVHVDPETAQISVASDSFPTVVHGIPLDLRDVRVNLNRPDFTLNPTSCEPAAVSAKVTSAQGATASPSSRFQAASCDRLGFKPKLSLKLKGGTKRSKHPALTAVLRARRGDANIGRVQVALPHSEFLAQNHIRTICTRVQFAAHACPPGSVYGRVTATSPLVDYPLTGKVYLRSSSHPLPDMVLALRGPASQPLEVDAVGRIDSVHGGIRTTFATVPDAPLTKVVLRLPGGKKSLLENSTDLCRSTNRASVEMDAHNGRVASFNPALKVRCPKTRKGGGHHGRR